MRGVESGLLCCAAGTERWINGEGYEKLPARKIQERGGSFFLCRRPRIAISRTSRFRLFFPGEFTEEMDFRPVSVEES